MLAMRRALVVPVALPVVLRAAWRTRRLARRHPLRELPDALRAVPPLRLALLRRHPAWLDGTLARLLPLLPPRGYGRCLKRSLILLDLWSRCGLRPVLHLGVRRPGQDPLQGHAWVSTGDPALDRRTGPDGWREMWSG